MPIVYPLWATTFVIHRLSPLYHGEAPIDNARLALYSRQLRDLISGEVLRGVRVGMDPEDDTLARVGALKTVRWSFLRPEEDWHNADGEPAGDGEDFRGVLVEITYEKAYYKAILLKEVSRSQQPASQPGFVNYPIVLIRMPNALKSTFTNFLETNFDTRTSMMKLPSGFIVDTLENYLNGLLASEAPGAAGSIPNTIRSVVGDLLVTVGFELASDSASLRTMDILVDKADVRLMVRRGRKLQEVQNAQEHDESVWGANRPFMKSLAHYIDGHTAINLKHEAVNVVKVACGAFVLGTEGKVKLFVPPTDDVEPQAQATKGLIEDLLSFAAGSLRS